MIHFIKRAFLSVIRKPAKSIILMMTIFFLSNLIAGSYAISTSTRNSLDDLKEAMAANITIHNKSNYSVINIQDNALEVFNDITKNKAVNYSNYGYTATIECKNIIYFKNDYYNAYDFNALQIKGITQPSFYELKNKDIVITRGRNFTEEEINEGSNYILLREEVFPCRFENDNEKEICSINRNSLNIGDKITLSHVVYQNPKKQAFLGQEKKVIFYEDEEYEIIGFYEILNKEDSRIIFYPNSDGEYVEEQTIEAFIPLKSLQMHQQNSIKLQKEYEQKYDRIDAKYELVLDQMIIQLNYGENVKEFTEYIRYIFEQKDINSIFVASSDDSYRLIAGPIESVSEISNIVLLLSIIASIIILAISSLSFLKERVHEIGIYLSLGEKKWKIAMQIVTEVFLIGIIAVTLSLPTGGYLGNIVCDKVITSNVEKTEQIIGDQLKELSAVNPEGITLKDAAEKVEIEYTSEYVIMLYGLCSIVLIISMIPPIIYILKLNPKKILM